MQKKQKPVTVIFAGGADNRLPLSIEHETKEKDSLLSSHNDIKSVIAHLGFLGDCEFTSRKVGKDHLHQNEIEHLADAVEASNTPWVIVLSDTKHLAQDSRKLESELKRHLAASKKIVVMTGSRTPLTEEEVLRPLIKKEAFGPLTEEAAALSSRTTSEGYENLKSAFHNKSGRESGMYVVTNRGEWMTPRQVPQTMLDRITSKLHRPQPKPVWSHTILGLEPTRSQTHVESTADAGSHPVKHFADRGR